MPDRYSFQSPFSRGSQSDPWFMAGPVAVTTTVFVTALAALGILIVVAEGGFGTVSSLLSLNTSALTGGQVWRFVTHIIPPDQDFFWALLGLLFFFMIGSQFESMVGRRAYTALLGALIVIPAVLGVIVGLAGSNGVPNFGLSLMFLGLAAGFSSAVPQAKSFFGIPFWVLVAFFFFIQLLGLLTNRSASGIVMLLATGAIGLIGTRSLGFSTVEWIPAVPLPASVTGNSVSSPQDKPRRSRKKKQKSSASHLRSVPDSAATEMEIDALLDQVSEQGIDSLSKKQKQQLERHSKEMRKRRDG